MFQWCEKHGILNHHRKDSHFTSMLIKFNDICLLDYFYELGYEFDIYSYIAAIKYGSRKILDWLWYHKVNYDLTFNCKICELLTECGANQMFQWFNDKNIININTIFSKRNSLKCIPGPIQTCIQNGFKRMFEVWFENPNHKILKYIIPDVSLDVIEKFIGESLFKNNDLNKIHLKSFELLNDKFNIMPNYIIHM